MRDADQLEVLMVRRRSKSSFMGGTYVFPGGGLEPGDSGPHAVSVLGGDPELLPWRAAAVRELAEEVGIWLTNDEVPPEAVDAEDPWQILARNGVSIDADSLVYFSNWVTPPQLTIRFDARFFAAEALSGSVAVADESEVFDATWITPRAALDRHDAEEWEVPIPTRAQLEVFAKHERVESVLQELRTMESVPRIEPNIGVDPAGGTTVLLPGDAGVPLDRSIEGSGH
ncbi:MAG: NUDIX hydrolase [Acidimicrobiia bacterium]|nr:NUDIX hydrolase [Acidimicrobiia bacterium]